MIHDFDHITNNREFFRCEQIFNFKLTLKTKKMQVRDYLPVYVLGSLEFTKGSLVCKPKCRKKHKKKIKTIHDKKNETSMYHLQIDFVG